MFWIILLIYFAIVIGCSFFYKYLIFKPGQGFPVVISLFWPLVFSITILYFVGKTFIYTIKKACQIFGG